MINKLCLVFVAAAAASTLVCVDAGKPLSVQVTLRGKKYDVSDVSTVKELQSQVEGLSGLSPAKQSLLFDGKKLKSDDDLEGSGVLDGSVINVVPAKKKSSSNSASKKTTAVETSVNGDVVSDGAAAGGGGGGGGLDSSMESLLAQSGIDKDKIDELMKSLPGGEDGKMPDMAESMKMMKDMVDSPLFQQYMTDPEKLEQSRQMILTNPMMMSMMKDIPGFGDILHDKEKWRETMVQAAEMYKNMPPDIMEKMMSGGMGGMPGMSGMPGMPGAGFGGMDAPVSPSGLDELGDE